MLKPHTVKVENQGVTNEVDKSTNMFHDLPILAVSDSKFVDQYYSSHNSLYFSVRFDVTIHETSKSIESSQDTLKLN